MIYTLEWVWWGVLLQFTETKNNFSACSAKSKSGRAKTQCNFVHSHKRSVGSHSGGDDLNCLLDI